MWNNHTDLLQNCLNSLEVECKPEFNTTCDQAFEFWKEKTVKLRSNGNIIYLIGNGASASMASHISADLAKNAHVHTQVFTDLALITALANDISFDQVFVEPLRRRLTPSDMLVAISSSGNSPNVVNACRFASELGAAVVTLTAMAPANKMRQIGDLNFWLPAETYGMAETGHACILHYWMDSVSVNNI
ncbi:D-sedoheptulose 7-phosphate isomerase [Maridesulfovibrio ferrireducens]|uniref:D-sedoheptulose 7-phosphate isomerase n=1 Tax=Maridesulfovibrio ferrireducens TaxID=246191 RepID=A0A1G9B5V3_9BACT|nr:SIS domain-containing protein [Maridesulfovibrio ferrireducens]SDK34868.1 D-sedoheptulose 7-phosphate isomerase [Maridesulfovibrio ferrireducens]